MMRVSKSSFQFHTPGHTLTLTSLEIRSYSSSSTPVQVTYNGTTKTYTLTQQNNRTNLNNITLNANSNFQITSTNGTAVDISIQITCPNVSGHIIYRSDVVALDEYHRATNYGSPLSGYSTQGQGNPIVARNQHGDTAGTTISRSFYEYYWNIS